MLLVKAYEEGRTEHQDVISVKLHCIYLLTSDRGSTAEGQAEMVQMNKQNSKVKPTRCIFAIRNASHTCYSDFQSTDDGIRAENSWNWNNIQNNKQQKM